ncbi:Glucosamine 6-phosphate synthetase [Methanophagales archaeon]|nr:Glucosamine 6-phosphate synthetase [Methanophagales archaeon]
MCGIFGILVTENSDFSPVIIKRMLNSLFKLSESRGKESAGLAIRTKEAIQVYKAPIAASHLIHTIRYKQVINRVFNCDRSMAIIGHSRLVTDGLQTRNNNNQPVIKNGAVGIHNGIIVNVTELFKRFSSMERRYDVDTEVILSLIQEFRNERKSLITSVQDTFRYIEGAASIAALFDDTNNVLLATNTGSLYTCMNQDAGIFVFASERYILEKLLKKRDFKGLLAIAEIDPVKPWHGNIINSDELDLKHFAFNDTVDPDIPQKGISEKLTINDLSPVDSHVAINPRSKPNDTKLRGLLIDTSAAVSKLRRCTRCVLPETVPGIEFDEDGVCNFCRNYKRINVNGEYALKEIIAPYRSKNGEPDCIVALSGGRDSSYALHHIKNVLKMDPIAYTYDWGMVTDLARRNQARLCGELGVEHIVVSADINRKRRNIRKNVNAWLKKPDLGTVPLFMAGDKQYFYYMNKLAKQTGIGLIIFGENLLERTDFKSGFCGIEPQGDLDHAYTLSSRKKLKLASYYGKEFLLNPSYINSSILDTMAAFFSYYLIPHQYLNLYDYIKWDEKKIVPTLIKEYNWEVAEDTISTWRIGDGTAPFYNYIYNLVAGFTENDTFRSNQIREGVLTRNEALENVLVDNKPRYESTKWYCDTNGLDFVKTIKTINSIPKLY